jgi:chromate transport protein ChrA
MSTEYKLYDFAALVVTCYLIAGSVLFCLSSFSIPTAGFIGAFVSAFLTLFKAVMVVASLHATASFVTGRSREVFKSLIVVLVCLGLFFPAYFTPIPLVIFAALILSVAFYRLGGKLADTGI